MAEMKINNEIHDHIISYNGEHYKRRRYVRQDSVIWVKRYVDDKIATYDRVSDKKANKLEYLFQNSSEVR